LLDRLGPVARAGAGDERSQARNRQLALERLAGRLAAALSVAPERRPTKPSRGAKERRLDEKRRRADVKRQRRPADERD
jgi:ribosome-associated protein